MFILKTLRSGAQRTVAPRQVHLLRQFSSTTQRQDFVKVTICGRLTSDPEITTSEAGKPVAKYSLAVNYGENTDYHNVIATGEGHVERLSKVKKGTQLLVDADLKINKITPEDGPKIYRNAIFHRGYHVVKYPRDKPEDSETEGSS